MDSRKIYFKFTGEKIEENKIKIWTDLDENDKNVIENQAVDDIVFQSAKLECFASKLCGNWCGLVTDDRVLARTHLIEVPL